MVFCSSRSALSRSLQVAVCRPIFAALLVLVAAPAAAQTITQLTDHFDASCFSTRPASDGQGVRVVFESNCDLVGTNADGNLELFSLSQIGLVQITETASCSNLNPSISDDGVWIAYDSDCNPVGMNVDGSVEIFLTDGAGSTLQLTSEEFCDSLFPSINATGDLVAYDSDCNPLGTNLDRSSEIFQTDDTGVVVQLTDDGTVNGCGSFNASSNGVGDLIAFESDCDLTGENFDGVVEIFNVTAGGAIDQLTLAGEDDCGSAAPSSNGDGTLIAFDSDCDYAGENADASFEIFLVNALSFEIGQVTDDDGTDACESTRASLANDGDDIWFTSSCDPLGMNDDGSLEIFRSELTGIQQVTQGVGCDSFSPAVAAQVGLRGVFAGNCDLVGMNTDGGDEIFEASYCVCGAPVSGAMTPVASDSLFTLNAAIGITQCALCECDVDDSGTVSATDALIILNASIGLPVDLRCP